MNLNEVRLRQRVPIWLLAQVGFWAGRWIGPRKARAAMANYQFFIAALGSSEFADCVDSSNAHGRTEAQMAEELGIKVTDLRAMRQSLRDHRR